MTLDVLFRSVGNSLVESEHHLSEIARSDHSEAQLVAASPFLESLYGDTENRAFSRAQTPMLVSKSRSPSKLPRTPTKPAFPFSSRFHLSSIYSSFRMRQVPESEHMPGEFPLDPSEESEYQELKITEQAPQTGLARLTRSVGKLAYSSLKDTMPQAPATPHPSSKRPIPRASTLPQLPDLDGFSLPSDNSCDYAIVVSMYEVYNDRIFDLLIGAATTSKTTSKDAKRRPLLFKCTEHSPDRKLVTGLRKILCSSLDEALLVLESGLTERRIAGTGSNAVSSRSHGFFCIEVKKKPRHSHPETLWKGATMTIVDLAGSERARTAKTAGTTLAEAGKINESLMYLGQCMQMQSDNANLSATSDPHLVPFRQCKLTELLFSNIFTQRGSANSNRGQSKGVMIVTADPRGDFNATSQILRYSALAREVTVPRIPSVTQSIIYPSLSKHDITSPTLTGRTSPTLTNNTAEEVLILSSELEVMQVRLAEEVERRKAAEESWALASSKAETTIQKAVQEAVEATDASVRAECMDAFDHQLAIERARWADAREEEREANERLMDDKIDLLRSATEVEDDNGGIRIHEDSWKTKHDMLEQENSALLVRLRSMETEMRRLRNQNEAGRTPSRKLKQLKTKRWVADADSENLDGNDENDLPVV